MLAWRWPLQPGEVRGVGATPGQHCLLTSLASGHAPLSQSVDRREEEPLNATNTHFHLHRALGTKVPGAYSQHRKARAQVSPTV